MGWPDQPEGLVIPLVLPASLAQERLWFLENLASGGPAYNIPVSVLIAAPVSPALLERCLAELARRHEALRTSFASDCGRVAQVVAPVGDFALTVVDLRRYPRHEREARLHAASTAECRRSFDLANGPLARATLYRLTADEHALLLVFHHIIADGWSVEVVVRELGELYAAFDLGLPSPLAPLAVQYGDWASWQRERLEGGALAEGIAHWRDRLAGAPTVLDLPTDRPRSDAPSRRGALETFVVEKGLADAARALARSEGCTLYQTMLAVFAALLSRVAGQRDLLIGTPITNRSGPELEAVVGLFVNTVVLRLDLVGAPTVRELLCRVRAITLDAHEHAEVPLEKLVDAVHPERAPGRNPLFQVLFSLNASARAAEGGTPARGSGMTPPSTGTTKFELSLLMSDGPGGLAGTWEYATDLFDAERVRRMGACFLRLLRAFVEMPDTSVDELPLMDEDEARMVARLELGERRVPRGGFVHERILARARRMADEVAVRGPSGNLTYAELERRATRLAAGLRARGVEIDDLVGIFLRRDVDLVVALVGIHAAGAAYVPLDHAHPAERLAHITSDARLTWIVTEEALAARLPAEAKPVLIDDEHPEGPLEPVATRGEHLAYVLYTSGTTGHPKGVAVTHGGVAALLDWGAGAFSPPELARVLASTSICFDISVFELFLPLCEGGSLVVVENVLALASDDAPDVTLINTVPSAMREVLRLWSPGPSLRTVNLAGEALSRDLVTHIAERAPGVMVWNLYGPTETTIYSTAGRLAVDDARTPSIGRPIDGTVVRVLDERLARVPIGVTGELYIGGAGVARGYLGRPELTAERYVGDPFAPESDARMYRTGDVVSWRGDGTLEYRGRDDQQVKLRGHRVELGEIESALRTHSRVRDVVVVARRDATLAAYVTMDAPDAGELEALARRELPSVMVPARFVFVEMLPRTGSGKIDRAALPAAPIEEKAPSRAPATETERALRELFATVLEVPTFGVEEDFFASGGHSLLATALVARANEALGLEIPLDAVFQHTTPASLAVFVDRAPRPVRTQRPRRRELADALLPLSPAQQGMWFYHRLAPRSALYNLPVMLPLRGGIDAATLQRAVDFVVARHEALRIRFETVEHAPVQRVDADACARLTVTDLSALPEDDRRRRTGRLIQAETRRPFDLRRAPLVRVSLVRFAPDEGLVVIVMHHIIADGWSTDVLRRDLAAAVEAFAVGGVPTLPEQHLGYGDYVCWLGDAVDGAVLEAGLAYFRKSLAGAPPVITLPSDRPRPPLASFRGEILTFEVDGSALADAAAARGATAHMAHLAIFAVLLGQLSGEDDVVIGIPVANRSRPEWREVIGLFTNTLPIRLCWGKRLCFASMLDRARKAAVGAYEHESVPFDRLVQEVSPVRDLSYHPIFQVMLGFQEGEAESGGYPDDLPSTGTAKFDLSLSLTRSSGRIFAALEYASDLFDRASVERIARRYSLLVEKLCAEPNRAIDEVAPLDVKERAWIERAALHVAVEASVSSHPPSNAPRTDIERRIAEIWVEALGHDRFTTSESFFEVGGHSLAAISVIARIAEDWGLDVPFERIFTAPTVAELAHAIEEAVAGSTLPEGPILRPVERCEVMPLSYAQERLWFLDRLAPELPTYNISVPIPWRGAVDVGVLERALERLGDRHEALRARFVPTADGGVGQMFDPIFASRLIVSDLRGSRGELERIQALEARHTFDLEAGPLLRAHLAILGPSESVLIVTVHHIVADAQSIDLLQRDLAAIYRSEVTGESDELPDLPLQFADYAVWQRAWLDTERLSDEIEHWRKKLAGTPAVLELPMDRPRPREQSHAGRQLPLCLGNEVAVATRRLAIEEQTTPFVVLLASYAVVLAGWSGARDLVIGTPVTGRPRRDLDDLIGFFSNTLPLRMELEGKQTFRALVRHAREVVIEALSHGDLPFHAMVQELQPRRSLAHNPLFQVMFAFQRPGDHGQTVPRLESEVSGTAKFDLTLFLADDDELHGAVEYATDLFDGMTIASFAEHLRASVRVAVNFPDAELGELFGASASDLATIEAWNATSRPIHALSAHEVFLASAAARPEAVAVSWEGGAWTYVELTRRAKSVTARLLQLDLQVDDRVAIVAESSPELIASVLGIWMAGVACVPLDPTYPADRLVFMAKAARARWLVGNGIPDLALEVVEPLIGDVDLVPAATRPEDLAYVVFTSGSTGRPKGVAVPHRVLVNLIEWQQTRGPARTLQFASPSFDVFFQEVLVTLATGGELICASAEVRLDPALLFELCRERRVERLFLPFVALRELAEAAAGRAPLLDLREVITAGEQLQVTPALRCWFASHPHCRLFNQYGPSETHVVTEEALHADPDKWPVLPAIGRPIANARCYVLDAEMRPLPIGVPGDLYLGGEVVARGYLDQPELTAEHFLSDPRGGRLYRSGDRVRWLPDGRLQFLGRGDDQVKIRGYRIELSEVETALAALPGVSQAVAAAIADAGGEKRLVGYVLATGDVDPAALRERLLATLPDPLVPTVIVRVDHLPRTASGKVDRRALPAPLVEVRERRPPGTELEGLVAKVWCEVLSVGQVGVDENFFDLGGHSLGAARVASRLRDRLGSEVAVRWIFEHPTVDRLARALSNLGVPATPDEIPIVPRGVPLPASFAQERLWFLDRMTPGSTAYNLTTAIDLPPASNADSVQRALDVLVRRHEVLRTVFKEVEGAPAQVIAPAARAALALVDLSYLAAHEIDAERHWRVEEEGRRAFSLERGPLFRATLLDFGAHGRQLILSMHHIISDGWSLQVLHRDLAAIHEAVQWGGRPELPALRLQYADYASWQRARLAGPALEALVAWWRTHLEGTPRRLELATDRARPPAAARGGTVTFTLDDDVARRLAALAREESATLFMAMLALWFELLRRYARQERFLVGTPFGARPRPELELVLGLFVNTLVLRADMTGKPSFRELVRRAREETLAATAHAELPFDRMVQELAPLREEGARPVVQVAFGLQHGVAPGATAGNGTAKFELSLVLGEVDGRLSGVLEFDRNLFDEEAVGLMAAHYRRLAAAAVAAPDASLAERDLVGEAERRKLLAWGTGAAIPAADLVAIVTDHARVAPHHVAVEAPDGTLTYRELDEAASRLAVLVGPSRAGVCLGATLHLPTVLLAIWRAGGSYVPLDPALPVERLAFIMRDAGVDVLITDEPGAVRLSALARRVVLAGAVTSRPAEAVAVDPEDPAYVVYTSGSSGTPKGVLVPYRGLRALVAAQLHALRLRPGDRVLKFATQSFDAAIFEMTAALSAGATLCLETQDELLPRRELVTLLRRRRVTFLVIPPSSLAVLPVEELADLRQLFVAGEDCPAELVARWGPGRRMINGYGPTETSVWATFAECRADGRKPPIGGPVANACLSVVDADLRLVPAGVPGELCIAGPQVASGYVGRPAASVAAFVSGTYRTGDVVRWRDDGSLEFLGRVDRQVKLRGVRIEPSEVEAAIASLPGVATSVVIAREDVLVGYVVPAPGAEVDRGEVRRAVAERLPRFLVPSRIVLLAELPRKPSGKLDRDALPAPPAEEREVAPPADGVERVIARIWSEVLSVPVGRSDDFFALGGHSLLVTRVLARVCDELGLEVPVRRIFDHPTLASFCEGLVGVSRNLNRIPPAKERKMIIAKKFPYSQQ